MNRLVFAVVAVFLCHSFASAAEIHVSYKQTNSGKPDHVAMDDSLPKASVSDSLNDNETNYDVRAEVDLSNPNALRTTTSLAVSAVPKDIMYWETMEARARAVATLVDTARVQGEFGANSGTIEFHWSISGSTTLQLDNAMNIGIDTATALTTLSSTILGTEELWLQELHTTPAGVDDYSMTFPASSGEIVVPAQWKVGEDLTLFFDLNSQLELVATNKFQHFEQFRAELSADFANSAVLEGVLIRDETGSVLPGARLVSNDPQSSIDYTPIGVPEPDFDVLMMFCVAGILFRRMTQAR